MRVKPEANSTDSVTIRTARFEDGQALRRLAQRDTRAVPEGELLVAFVDGEVRAALSMASAEAIADPFHRTAHLVDVLALNRAELVAEPAS